MRKLVLGVGLLLAGGAFSQVYSEDFEALTVPALPAGWTQVTAATDGGFKSSTNYTSTYFSFPAHTKYVGTNDDVCNCDKSNEKLISPSIAVPTGTTIVSFEYVLGQFYGETGKIGISTDGGTTVTSLATLAPTNGGGAHVWTSWSGNISSYAGQSINLVWTYDDNADWGSGMMIDDVLVFQPSAVDMEMTALTMTPWVNSGNVSIAGTITSLGANTITSVDITWNDGSGPNTQTFPVNLNIGDTYNFTHGTALNAVAGNDYNITVTVTAASDANNANDALSTMVSAVTSIVPKVVVGEERTGEWCGWCPRGAVALAEMSISNPNDFIGIAVHNGDAMAFTAYDGAIGAYIPPSFPGGGVDRVIEGDPGNFAQMHAQRSSHISPASIAASGQYDGTSVTVDIDASFVGSMSGDYRLAAVLVEDGVSGAGQANYYSGGGAGPMQMPNTGSMPLYDFAAGPSTVNPYVHDHVAIALGNNQINGSAGSLPASITAGSNATYSYTFAQNSAWNMSNVHVVGMLVNGTTGEILNAGKGSVSLAGLNELEVKNFTVTAMPNPTNGMANIVVDLKEAAEMDIVVVDMLGKEVFNLGSTSLTAGSFVTNVDLSNESEGMYFAKVAVNGTVQTVKINLVK